jgi:lysylphosphatidylglycerol synthetase-like protein (DUF2156 family)
LDQLDDWCFEATRDAVFQDLAPALDSAAYNYEMFYFWAVNLIPLALISGAWVCRYTNPITLSKGRRILFLFGLITSTIGSALLISFLMVSIADPSQVGHVNIWDGRLLISGFLTALAGLALAFNGKGIERVLSALSSIALIVLFYIDGLATSI